MLIGLNGPARAGKDTVCQMIQKALAPLVVRREAFADPLKVSAARALGFQGTTEECVEFCDLLKAPTTGIVVSAPGHCHRALTGREYLQWYGTEAHREVFGDDFWVRMPIEKHRADPTTIMVITDCRFPNEAAAIQEVGGQVWRIERAEQIAESGHASEQRLADNLINRTIRNYSSLDALRANVRLALKETFGVLV